MQSLIATLLRPPTVEFETLIVSSNCLLSAGKAEGPAKLAKKTGSDGIHYDNPSFDVDEYVKYSMLRPDEQQWN